MSPIKSIRLVFLATAFLLISTGIVGARAMRSWSYQELLDSSDLVVIATPTATNDTKKHIDLPGMVDMPALGIETKFAVSTVLKGDKALKEFILHHYRADVIIPMNGPNLVSFSPHDKRSYILFLVREADGRFAPTVGQTDPGMFGIQVVGMVENQHLNEITKDKALEIARERIRGMHYDKTQAITIEDTNGQYRVTFPVSNESLPPPGTRRRGASYAAEVLIDKKTGKVIQSLVGP